MPNGVIGACPTPGVKGPSMGLNRVATEKWSNSIF